MQILNLSPDLTPGQQYAIKQAVANVNLENIQISNQDIRDLEDVVTGRRTADDVIKQSTALFRAEAKCTTIRLSELQRVPIHGKFDFKHLCDIHHHIFRDLYDWAGKPRTVDIGKGNLFCLVRNLYTYADSVFQDFAKDCQDNKSNPDTFIHTLANHYGDLNALHPFREGNGRSQREFARELCLSCGYEFDLSELTHEEMLKASIISFNNGDNSLLEKAFQKAVKPIEIKHITTRALL